MAGKVLNINPIYARFFIENNDSRYLVMQGSRRSGKSLAVFQWITLKLLATKKECCVICSTYPNAMNAVKDFQLATGLPVSGNQIYGSCHIFDNGSVIYFKAFDDPTKAQGTFCDYAIVEEALNIDEQIFNVFSLSIREQVFFIYNPTKTSWCDKYIAPDKHNYLKTTFKDNPYLSPEQLEFFENIKRRAASPTASVLDIYNKKVYYDGDFSEMGGSVFPVLYTCTEDEYKRIKVPESLGLDFGWTDGRDATVLIGVKIFENCLYIKEYINSSHLTNNKDLAFAIASFGFDCFSTIFADYASCGKEKINALCSAGDYSWTEPEICRGFNVLNAKKGRVVDGLQKMLQYDKIIITEKSIGTREEFSRYELGPEGEEVSKHQNCVDAARYATVSYNNLY